MLDMRHLSQLAADDFHELLTVVDVTQLPDFRLALSRFGR
jgi:hypothetical protein